PISPPPSVRDRDIQVRRRSRVGAKGAAHRLGYGVQYVRGVRVPPLGSCPIIAILPRRSAGISRWRLCYEVMGKSPACLMRGFEGEIGAGGLGFVAVQPRNNAPLWIWFRCIHRELRSPI